MQPDSSPTVPLDTPDPIQHLLDNGSTIRDLSVAWCFKTDSSVYQLKRFEYTPPPETARRMAASFGWTAGDVVNYWLDRVGQKAAEA